MSEINTKYLTPYSNPADHLEPDYQRAYNAWKQEPNKKTTGQLLTTVQPAIDRAIRQHVGEPHALIRSRARNLVVKALPTYDSKKSSLSTYITNQLYGLRRINRHQSNIISVPERWAHESYVLSNEESSLSEMLGRAPTTQELADRTGLSAKRIERIRTYNQPMSEGYMAHVSDAGSSTAGGYSPKIQDDNDRWADIVYMEQSPVDQKIMEHTLGLYGQPILKNQQLASMLGLSPGAISQRKARIQEQLNNRVQVF